MKTSVLLLVYNRPEQTERVLKRLAECGVDEVYVSADGPKTSADRKAVSEVNSVLQRYNSIIKNTQFSDQNLGCKNAVVSGIDWFFNQVQEGMILEDDCLPSEHFFPFISDMLDRYREAENIMMVGGNNPLGEWQSEGEHFFSRIGTIWGWATWKNRWQNFDSELPELNAFIDDSGFEKHFGPTSLSEYRKTATLKAVAGKIDTWDYQWNVHILMNNGLAVIPTKNLVQNIGFDASATNDSTLPNWIDNSVSQQPISVSERPIEIDREFEMEWHLARRSNSSANPSRFSFNQKGKAGKGKLKVLLINSTDIGGGAEKIAFTIHQKLLEFGHDSKLFVEFKKSDMESVLEIDNWKAQLEELNPDVIHVHNLHGTSIDLAGLTETSKRIPTLFTLHDSWLVTGSIEHPFEPNPEKLNLLELLSWKREFNLRKNAVENGNFCFTTPSQWMRELFFNAHGIRPFYVPNAIEPMEPIEVEIPSKRFILFVANRPETNPYKDFATLKTAWKKANESLGENGCDLIVLGGESKTENIGIRTLFIIENQSTESVLAFMEKSFLLVQASLKDNAPLTVLEAHSACKNVVGALVGGIPELMNEQEQDWLYEAGNAIDLCEKLIAAISSETRDREIRDKEKCSVESIVSTYLGHYLSLTNA